jgi:hypothetical protein
MDIQEMSKLQLKHRSRNGSDGVVCDRQSEQKRPSMVVEFVI